MTRSSPRRVFSMLPPMTLYDLKIKVLSKKVPRATAPTKPIKDKKSLNKGCLCRKVACLKVFSMW